jgi:4-oxalocrotonate tautomerase
MPFANFKVPAGTLTAAQKELIVHRTTDLYAEIYGERARAGTMVLVEEVPDGGWGIGDQVLTLAQLSGAAHGSAGDHDSVPAGDGSAADHDSVTVGDGS